MQNQGDFRFFYNGIINTMEPGFPVADSLLVQGNHIRYCGKSTDVNLPVVNIEKIDLAGKYVFPSFTDCHTHVAAVALDKERLRLDTCQSLAKAIQEISKFVEKTKPDQWILGGGWNANIWPEGWPAATDLDQISQKHPIALYNKDGHTQWLNSLALEKCGFTPDCPDPEGGRLARDDKGNLTGLVYEKACEIVEKLSDITSFNQLARCMDQLYPELFGLGITGVHSCDGFDKYKIFQQLQSNNRLKIRVCMHPPEANVNNLINSGLHSGEGNAWLRLGGLKYFMDGSLGSQTAEMFEPFTGTDIRGIGVLSEEDFYSKAHYAAKHGLSATVHAIGDLANYKALNVFEKLTDLKTPVPLRHRIEHSQILLPDDIKRFARRRISSSSLIILLLTTIKSANFPAIKVPFIFSSYDAKAASKVYPERA